MSLLFYLTPFMSFAYSKGYVYHLFVPFKTLHETHQLVGVILADVGLYPPCPFYLRATTMDFASA